MIVYTEGVVIAVSKESFDDREGAKVEYCVNVIKTGAGIETFNSKRDFSEFEGKEGVIALRLTEDSEKKNRFKVSVQDVRLGETMNLPENQVN